MHLPTPEAEPVNTGANLAGENQTFAFRDQSVRTVIKNGEPWFVAKDVCDVLGIANSRDAVSRIRGKDKGVASCDTPGGVQNLSIISEAGLYCLVLRSDKPAAEPFIDWVTSEVLPILRRTGRYAMPKAPVGYTGGGFDVARNLHGRYSVGGAISLAQPCSV